MIWGISPSQLDALNQLLPAPVTLTSRTASSLELLTPDPLTRGLTAADLYFSELRPPEITTNGLDGPLVRQGIVLLQASGTDWLKWNKQPEYAKTAMVLRSERETHPAGAVLIRVSTGGGQLLITTLPAAPRSDKAEKLIHRLLFNLGAVPTPLVDVALPLRPSGEIVPDLSRLEMIKPTQLAGSAQLAGSDQQARSSQQSGSGQPAGSPQPASSGQPAGSSQSQKTDSSSEAWLSFWVSSPRSLDDLLAEPDIPVVGLEVATDDVREVWLNDRLILDKAHSGTGTSSGAIIGISTTTIPSLHLMQGWNHFRIKLKRGPSGWSFAGHLVCNRPEFLTALGSAMEKP